MAPGLAHCEECGRVRSQYVLAISEVNRLSSKEFAAVVGGADFQESPLLQKAREHRQQTKDALLAHLVSHCCVDSS